MQNEGRRYRLSKEEVKLLCKQEKRDNRYTLTEEEENILLNHRGIKKHRNVLIIGDLHLPFIKKGYFEHCIKIKEKYNCNEFVFIGDIIDNHYSSFHDSDPDGMGAGEEIKEVHKGIKKWYEAFPNGKVCLGNHDLIPNRKAFNAGLSRHWVKDIKEVFQLWDWDFADSFVIDDIVYEHGMGGKAMQRSKRELISVVQGHYHADMYIHYTVGRNFKIFGMQVGCGVDQDSYAMAYGKYFPKPAIGCAVILNNGTLPILEPMILGK